MTPPSTSSVSFALANQLRSDGVEAWIDQYTPDPDEGWPHWMRAQVKEADKVLLVFTETYQRRFDQAACLGETQGGDLKELLSPLSCRPDTECGKLVKK
jgi:hypothetical protein